MTDVLTLKNVTAGYGLITVLNDLCLLAPAALVDAPLTWHPLDARRVGVEFGGPGHPVSAELLFDADGRAYRSRFGLATFVRDEFAVLGQAQAFVHGTYRSGGWGEPPVPRNMHALRLFDPASRRGFVVAHLHGLRDLDGKHDSPARDAQAHRVVEMIDQVREDGDPVVFGGDLNLLPDSRSFAIWAEAGLSDLITGRGFTDTRTSLYPKEQRHADYLLVSEGISVAGFDVVTAPEVSDHRPLVLDFSV